MGGINGESSYVLYITRRPPNYRIDSHVALVSPLSIHDNVYDPEARISLSVSPSVWIFTGKNLERQRDRQELRGESIRDFQLFFVRERSIRIFIFFCDRFN